MLRAGLTQREIARVFNVSQPNIAGYARRLRRQASSLELDAAGSVSPLVGHGDRTT
jgi:transcriptional regulator with XRE-family HTH domain